MNFVEMFLKEDACGNSADILITIYLFLRKNYKNWYAGNSIVFRVCQLPETNFSNSNQMTSFSMVKSDFFLCLDTMGIE